MEIVLIYSGALDVLMKGDSSQVVKDMSHQAGNIPEAYTSRKMVKAGLAIIQGCLARTPCVPASTVIELHSKISPK